MLCELDRIITSYKNLTSRTALSVTNFAIFSLKIFQEKLTIFTKCILFGQTLVFLPLRKPDLYI